MPLQKGLGSLIALPYARIAGPIGARTLREDPCSATILRLDSVLLGIVSAYIEDA